MKYKLKITTGFSDDQKFTIDGEEAHKAYYLFRNPEKRGVFSNGIALIGKNIQSIAPDWNATMGWNATHKLDDYDWDEINGSGVKEKMFALMGKAEDIALQMGDRPELFARRFTDIHHLLTAPKQNVLEKYTQVINKL